MIAATVHGPSPLWYATRGAGAMTLVLLSASVAMGIAEVRRWQPVGAPRFAMASIHRIVSLLALALLVIHVGTTILDPFPHIGLVNAVVPFVSSYRALWMGLGTLASDLLLALVVTSLLRKRLGHQTWAALHWSAYACWPIGVLHGLGTGSDTRTTWMLVLTLACVALVLAALAARVRPSGARARRLVLAAAAGGAVGLAVWLPQGPLARGWARRAGTPASVLAAFSPRARPRLRPPRALSNTDGLARPFSASVAGSIAHGVSQAGVAVVDLRLRLGGTPAGALRIRLGGEGLPDGGLHMDRSAVTLGPPGNPAEYQGRIEFLRGSVLRALVGSRGGHAVRLTVNLALGTDSATGQVRGVPVPGVSA
jgi:sulfoxide reductase heme-binding subunit YedZ